MSSTAPAALLFGLLAWTLLTGPSQAALLEAHDPLEPEVLVSLQTQPEDAPSAMTLHAEFWVSRPEMILVTLHAPGDVALPAGGLQPPPLRMDGATLSPRRCYASKGRFQFPMTLEEFTGLLQAKKVHWQAEVKPLEAAARAPLRELWARLRPMVRDPAFRAHTLLREGSPEAISTLLRGGWGANRPTYVGKPPLSVVSAQGNLDGVNVLLKAGAMLDGVDKHGRTALHQAIRNGHTDLAIELLDRGASPTQADRLGMTPLHLAVRERNATLVQNLLERGASPNTTDLRGMTALHLSIEAGPDASPTLASSDPAVLHSVRRAEPVELAETLLRFRADPRLTVQPSATGELSDPEQDPGGLDAFGLALRRDDETMVAVLRQSPLATPQDVPTLNNDLTEADALQALQRLQARIRLLSPARFYAEYLSQRYREAFEQTLPPGDTANARTSHARPLRSALDPRFATATLLPASEPGTAAFDLSVRLSESSANPWAVTLRLVFVQENGAWKIDRLDGAPDDAIPLDKQP